MPRSGFSAAVREGVIIRSGNCCEYCKSQDKYSPNGFTIDHIVPESLGGTDDLENLAYACFLCNRLKSKKLHSIDGLTETHAPIYNPRIESWHEHFAWNEDASIIVGISPTGRGTVAELKLNREKLIEYRKAILPLGTHPPK
jgi:hypothetical protein